MTVLTTHPVLAAAVLALFANLFVAGAAYGVSGAADRHMRRLIAWARQTSRAPATAALIATAGR
jgi:hypothetical protein